jgi:perosamine synthetase
MAERFIPIAKVSLSDAEINAVIEVLKSGSLRQGKKTEEFESAFAEKVGAQYAIAVSSGTAALHIAYLAVLNPGDEVLVPTFSHISTASMVHFAGCKPVFCDIDPRTFTLDLEDAKKKVTNRTAAIAPVHLFGNACDIDGIIAFAREHGLKIIWDAAQAHGTKYGGKDVGCFDDLVCYSFYPTKNMITGEGGMITTNDAELAEKCRLLRSHGQTQKYYHPSLGFNYRMTDIEAAIGLEQLKKLDYFVQKRRENAAYLTERLLKIEAIIPPYVSERVEHSYHQYTILLDLDKLSCTRDEFTEALKAKGIGTGVHYPRPLHKQPAFEALFGSISLPVSEDISKRILSLPVHPALNKEDLDSIAQAVENVIARVAK